MSLIIIFDFFLVLPLNFGDFVCDNTQRVAYLITHQCFGLLPDAEIRELGAGFQEHKKDPANGSERE